MTTMHRRQTTTVLVEDNPDFREIFSTFLRDLDGYTLAAAFDSADALLATLSGDSAPWNLVLMDIELPGTSGIDATRQIKKRFPGVAVVMLTVFEEPATIVQAICAGADGYLLKRTPARDLRAQLAQIHRGGAPLSPGVAQCVLDLIRHRLPVPGGQPGRLGLTDREQEVLRALVDGLAYQGVADRLGVSIDTIRSHVRSVYKKLQVHSAAEAVRRAIRERLI